MALQEYTTEELIAELKRRSDLAKTKKAKVKICRMCKHWGEIDYLGNPGSPASTSCLFHKTKNGKYYCYHASGQLACEHFEHYNN